MKTNNQLCFGEILLYVKPIRLIYKKADYSSSSVLNLGDKHLKEKFYELQLSGTSYYFDKGEQNFLFNAVIYISNKIKVTYEEIMKDKNFQKHFINDYFALPVGICNSEYYSNNKLLIKLNSDIDEINILASMLSHANDFNVDLTLCMKYLATTDKNLNFQTGFLEIAKDSPISYITEYKFDLNI